MSPPRDHAALLGRALGRGAAGAAGPVIAALAALPTPLPWFYHYAPRATDDDLAERIAFAEIAGPDGPMSTADARWGLTLMAEHTVYPMHAHPAVELYYVLSGRAEWRAGTLAAMKPPGALILHRSDEPHAMRTQAEPLLALWGWSGDLDTPAFYL